MTCDLLVLGGGPAGYEAALEAASLGLKTILVERDALGGTCLNRGCIPTKLLLGATAAVEELAAQAKLRLAEGSIRTDLAALVTRKDRLLEATRKAMRQKLAALGVEFVQGDGRVLRPGAVEVQGPEDAREIAYAKLLLATGSRPSSFPGLTPDGGAVLDSTGFLELTAMPASLIVVGAGFIGLEMAQAAHRFGCSITLVDALDRVAAQEDAEVSAALLGQLKRWKWDVRLGVKVASLVTRDGKAALTLDSSQEIVADKALVAVGRRPNTENLGLEALGVTPGRGGYAPVDDHLRAAPDVYAAGDVNGIVLLAHAASHQARYIARHAAGRTDAPYLSGPVPSILYGSPEVLRVGRLPGELLKEGRAVKVSAAPLAANPIAQAHGQTQGFVKVIWSEGRVAGVTALGYDVSRMATTAALMVRDGWTREQAEDIIFPHPTLDETLWAAFTADPKDIPGEPA
ncbi:FAD-dependent oxidoreductase [Desulfovibrio aminophilus]|uniref:dihydrolipoyl dehydrogenase family protein n=1 Tax=Desulfovibrio aminophilus TaxID=81425 RepID=UPI003393C182